MTADDRCNITDDGKAALLRLSKGDMRRALNVLQVGTYPLLSLPFSASSTVSRVMRGEYFRHPIMTSCSTRAQADLQACHAAYDKIDETAVYTCTGNPQPKDIERVVQSMMSDEFGTSYSRESLASSLFSLY
jgi:replication factor C subunit 3/5